MFSRRSFLKKMAMLGGVILSPVSTSFLDRFKGPDPAANFLQIGNFILKFPRGESTTVSSQTATQPTDWVKYSDPDYGISFDYPTDWEHATQFIQMPPYEAPNAILKRERFSGLGGVIDVDIWDAHGYALVEWMKWWHSWTEAAREAFEPEQPNAKVLESPAILFLEKGAPDQLKLFFVSGKYVFRLNYSIFDATSGLEVFSTMANTWGGDSQQRTAAILPYMEIETPISPMVYTCCGYSAPGCTFPCQCSSDPNKQGNCTWWVYYCYGSVPFTGDAGTWWNQVPNIPNWYRQTGTPPTTTRSIAWRSGSPGHVAYIASYTGGPTYSCTEMFWCSATYCKHTGSYPTSYSNGYIFYVAHP